MHSENNLHLEKNDFVRNICIGLIDGLTIPFALAAGLSGLVSNVSPVIIACLVAAVAGSVTMTVGGYLEVRKYITKKSPASSAVPIGAGYLIGGLIVTFPYFFVNDPLTALLYSAIITMVVLFAAGYCESKLSGANGWTNAFRVFVTAALVAAAAFLVAKLFR
jgi:VIT1/CCC1 family predicted Fe2+/Mn2+ transporter